MQRLPREHGPRYEPPQQSLSPPEGPDPMAFDDPSRREDDTPQRPQPGQGSRRLTWVRARELPTQVTGTGLVTRAVQAHDRSVRTLPRLPFKAIEWARTKHDQRAAARQERAATELDPFSTPDQVSDPSAGPEGIDSP